METIPRLSRSKLHYFRRFTQKKHREADHKFLVEGSRLVAEALASGWNIEALMVTREFLSKPDSQELLHKLRRQGIDLALISESDLGKLSDTVTSQGIIGLVSEKTFDLDQLWNELREDALIVALDDIADPGNLGTILRTCDWFGVNAVLLNRNAVELWNPKVVRATMGAVFHLPILPGLDLPAALQRAKRKGFRVVVTSSSDGKHVIPQAVSGKSILVFGNEARGVSREIKKEANELITIAKFGRAESLNVAIACGIVLAAVRIGSRE